MRIPGLILAALLSSQAAFADLTWETTSFSREANVTESKTEAVFVFKNTGDKPVTIESVKTSCGCTTAALEKNVYEPGETGEIKASFNHGDRSGVQHKTITVITAEDAQAKDYTLSLEVRLPKIVERIMPQRLEWNIGEAPEPKTVTVELNGEYPIAVTDVQLVGAKENFQVVKTEKIDATHYTVTVIPADTSARTVSSVRITTNFPEDNPTVAHFLARVR